MVASQHSVNPDRLAALLLLLLLLEDAQLQAWLQLVGGQVEGPVGVGGGVHMTAQRLDAQSRVQRRRATEL